MTQWYPASPALWQGRDDSIEAPDARRLFQTVTRSETFSPENWQQKIALMGFACDEGVKRNAGRPGAAGAPDALRKALANMASHQGHERLVDLGNWVAPTPDLEGAQQALRDAVSRCLRAGMRTLVLGVPLIQVLRLIEPVCRSGKLQAADLVEFNPRFDEDGAAARVAARLGWQIAHWWR
ncbi:TPA: hypothetical protein G8B97_002722 [Salmonella enterica]|nr:hypothetical protein [Salmonella enterica]